MPRRADFVRRAIFLDKLLNGVDSSLTISGPVQGQANEKKLSQEEAQTARVHKVLTKRPTDEQPAGSRRGSTQKDTSEAGGNQKRDSKSNDSNLGEPKKRTSFVEAVTAEFRKEDGDDQIEDEDTQEHGPQDIQ